MYHDLKNWLDGFYSVLLIIVGLVLAFILPQKVFAQQPGTYDPYSFIIWFNKPAINQLYICNYWAHGDSVELQGGPAPTGVMPIDTDLILNRNVIATLKELGADSMQEITNWSPCQDSLSITRYGDTILSPDFWDSYTVFLRDSNAAQAVGIMNSLYQGSVIQFAELNSYFSLDTLSDSIAAYVHPAIDSKPLTLQQNDPNPFTGETTVSFYIPRTTQVTLKIYDVLGKEMSTIIAGRLNPGYYTTRWDGSAYPQGCYFYCLTSGASGIMKQMILTK
jgi:hypothetical protein